MASFSRRVAELEAILNASRSSDHDCDPVSDDLDVVEDMHWTFGSSQPDESDHDDDPGIEARKKLASELAQAQLNAPTKNAEPWPFKLTLEKFKVCTY